MATYFTLLTKIGQASVANAVALGTTVSLTNMAVGDGNGNPTTPNENQTTLVREKFRASINQLTVDPANPNYVICEMIIPTSVGGWSVNEVAIFDSADNLFAVANFPATYKPQIAEGSGRDLIVRIYIQVSNASVVNLMIDPAVVLASRKWVADNYSLARLLPGGTTNQVLAKKSNADGDTKWIDPNSAVNVIVATVEESQTLADAQVIVDLATITTQGIGVYIEGVRLRRSDQYTVNTSTRITLSKAYPATSKITLVQNDQTGNTMLARLDGANFTGPTTGVTPAQFDETTKHATMAAVQRAIGSNRGTTILTTSSALTLAHIGQRVVMRGSTGATTFTMPDPALCTPGASITVHNLSSFTLSLVQAKTADRFISAFDVSGTAAVYQVAPGQEVTLTVYNTSNVWLVGGPAAQTKLTINSPQNGFEKSASGRITQWISALVNGGTPLVVTLPTPFLSEVFYASVTWVSSSFSGGSASKGTFALDISNLNQVTITPTDSSGTFQVSISISGK